MRRRRTGRSARSKISSTPDSQRIAAAIASASLRCVLIHCGVCLQWRRRSPVCRLMQVFRFSPAGRARSFPGVPQCVARGAYGGRGSRPALLSGFPNRASASIGSGGRVRRTHPKQWLLDSSYGSEPVVGVPHGEIPAVMVCCEGDRLEQFPRQHHDVVAALGNIECIGSLRACNADVAGHDQQPLHPVVEIARCYLRRERDMKSFARMISLKSLRPWETPVSSACGVHPRLASYRSE